MALYTCDSAGCSKEVKSVVLDSNWRWIHNGQYTNCYKEWEFQRPLTQAPLGSATTVSLCPKPRMTKLVPPQMTRVLSWPIAPCLHPRFQGKGHDHMPSQDGDWDATLCPDPVTCAANCHMEGNSEEHYKKTYGINAIDDGLRQEAFFGRLRRLRSLARARGGHSTRPPHSCSIWSSSVPSQSERLKSQILAATQPNKEKAQL